MRSISRHLASASAASFGLVFPASALAYQLPSNWATGVCAVSSYFCSGGGGAAGLQVYVATRIVPILEIGFIAVAALMLFIYAATLVLGSNDEGTVSEIRTGYSYAIAGAAVVGLAHLIVYAFSPVEVGPDVVHTAPLKEGFGDVITYFNFVLAIALLFNVIYQALRLIIAQSDEENDKAKKRLLYGFIGVAIVLLAHAIVRAFDVEGAIGGSGQSESLAVEIRGIANFLLGILGFLSVAAIIVAGFLLVISADESLKDKAKNIIKTAVIVLAVVLSSYAIVSTFILLPQSVS